MIVSLELSPASARTIAQHQDSADAAKEAIADALQTAAVVGADSIVEQLVRGQLGLTMRHPASGLAASVRGWMIDASIPLAAVGVPANAPAASYAAIHETGGTVRPKNARALAIPVSPEAKQYTSPRDMADLTMIPRKGRPPLLVRMLARSGDVRGFELHWVLVQSVTIAATHWLTRGAAAATPDMVEAMDDSLGRYTEEWN